VILPPLGNWRRKVGDKDADDTWFSAYRVTKSALRRTRACLHREMLSAMVSGAEAGMNLDSGTASAYLEEPARLGDRSIGRARAGDCPAVLILRSMGESITRC